MGERMNKIFLGLIACTGMMVSNPANALGVCDMAGCAVTVTVDTGKVAKNCDGQTNNCNCSLKAFALHYFGSYQTTGSCNTQCGDANLGPMVNGNTCCGSGN